MKTYSQPLVDGPGSKGQAWIWATWRVCTVCRKRNLEMPDGVCLKSCARITRISNRLDDLDDRGRLMRRNYAALDRRTMPPAWRNCRVLIIPKGVPKKGAKRNALIWFEGDPEPVVRPWRGIKRIEEQGARSQEPGVRS